MSAIPPSRFWLLCGGVLASSLLLGACSTVSNNARTALSSLTPYRVEVVQGNFVSKEQVEQLKPGMSRQQVREVLGTSLLTDVFHKDRWDYVFTMRRQGVEPQQRRLTLYFDGDRLARFEGDEMPSETEFVALVDNHRRTSGTIPKLEATPEELQKLAPKEKPNADGANSNAASTTASLPPLPAAYPPLESTR